MTPRLFDAAGDDAAPLAPLHRLSFPDPWDEKAICELLAGPGVFVFFTQDGFVMARAVAEEAEILTIAVAPAARGHGQGRALLAAAAGHAQALGATHMFLEVGGQNVAALALYAGLGFVPVGQRPGYYAGKDALILKTGLPLSPRGKFA